MNAGDGGVPGSDGGGGGSDGGGGGSDGSLPSPDLARNCLMPDLKAFNLDVRTVAVSGKLTVNHAAINAGTTVGWISLHNANYDDVKLADLGAASYSQQVVPDTYDVILRLIIRGSGSNLPTNYQVKIAGPVTLSAATTLDIDIPATTVSGQIKLNHAAPPTSGSYGELRLRAPKDSVNEAVLGSTLSGAYSALVAPGTYDLYYVHSDGTAVPGNYQTKLKSGVVVGAAPLTLDADIPSVLVSGKLTINGAAPPASTSDSGDIYFADPVSGDELRAARTSDQSYSLQVSPGTYDVYYQRNTLDSMPTSAVPRNFRVYLKKGVNMTSPVTLDLDVPAATVSGALKLNGAAPPAMAGTVRLISGIDGAFLGTLAAGSYSQLVAPGTYDLYYVGEYGGGAVADSYVKLQSGIVVHAGANTLDVNVVTYSLGGNFTVNGAPPPATASAKIGLRDPKTGDQLSLGDLAAGHYAVKVVAQGTWDLTYDWKSGAGVPVNTNASLPLAKSISGAATVNLDIPAVSVAGQMTFNGAPLSGGTEAGTFSLYTPGSALLGDSSAVSYSVMVLPGIYDVTYQYKSGTNVVPHDSFRNLFCAHIGN